MLYGQAKQRVVGSVYKGLCLALIVSLSLGASGPAYAAGALGITFDPTMYIEQIAGAIQRAETVTSGAESYVVQLEQLYTMEQNLRSNPLQTLTDTSTPVGGLLQNYQNLAYNTSALQSDLQNQNQAFGGTYSSYTLSNLSPTAFIAQEKAAAMGTNNLSGNEAQTAVETMKATNAQWGRVKAAEANVPANSGIQKNMQLLNNQMNTVTAQNQEMITAYNEVNVHNAAKDARVAGHQKLKANTSLMAHNAMAGQRQEMQHVFSCTSCGNSAP